MVVPWGDDIYGQCDLWPGITNAVQVTGGIEFSIALLNNGTVTGWGYNGVPSSELVPTNLEGVAMIASGWQHNVALMTNGTVTAWGDDFYDETDVPDGLTNITTIFGPGIAFAGFGEQWNGGGVGLQYAVWQKQMFLLV